MRRNLCSAIAALALAVLWNISPAQAQEIQTNNIVLTSNWNDGNVAAGSMASGCCNDNACCEAVDSCNSCCDDGGFVGGVELLTFKAHTNSQNNALGGLILGPGPTWDWEVAPRIWFGKENGDGLGARLRYFQFDHNAANPGVLTSSSLELHALDAEIYQTGQIQRIAMMAGGGLRYSSQNTSNSVAGLGSLTQQFDGVGPTFFVNGAIPVGDRGFSLYAGGRASITFGDNKAIVPGVFNGRIQDQSLTTLELASGLQWTSESGKYFFRSGFEAQTWHTGQPGSNLAIPIVNGLVNATDIGLIGTSVAIGIRR